MDPIASTGSRVIRAAQSVGTGKRERGAVPGRVRRPEEAVICACFKHVGGVSAPDVEFRGDSDMARVKRELDFQTGGADGARWDRSNDIRVCWRIA